MALQMCCRCGKFPCRGEHGGYCRQCESVLSAVRYFAMKKMVFGQGWADRAIARKSLILEALKAANEGRKLPK